MQFAASSVSWLIHRCSTSLAFAPTIVADVPQRVMLSKSVDMT